MTPDANDLCVFAVKRGNIEKRIDVGYCLKTQVDKFTTKFRIVRLGDIISDIYRYPTFYGIDYCPEGIGVLKGENIARTGHWININKLDCISNETNEKFSRTVLNENDLVMTVRGEVGKVAIVEKSLVGCNINANVIKIALKVEYCGTKIYPYYVWCYLNSDIGKKSIRKQVAGGVQETITVSGINEIEIVLPDFATQVRLAFELDDKLKLLSSKLRQADELLAGMSLFIHSVLKMNEITDEKPAFFAIQEKKVVGERFDPEYHNPFYTRRVDEIRKHSFDTLGNIINFSSETWNQKDYFSLVFPYIEISNVHLKENKYDISDTYISDAPSRAKMIVRNSDIIVSTTRPHRGAVATIQCAEDEIQIASTGFCVLREMKRNDVLKEYLQWILLDDYVLLQMLQRSSGGNYPAIVPDELKKIVIPIPSIEDQRTICKEAKYRQEKALQLRHEAEQEWNAARAQFEKELLGEG